MNRFVKIFSLGLLMASTAACSRIETGEVGVRRGFDKQVDREELLPGSFNQTLIGSVLKFPTKEVSVEINDMHPLAADNSTVADFDLSVIYNINPTQVAELFIDKTRTFHASNDDGEIFLMYNYITTMARNAAYKTARKYPALSMSDNRSLIEQEIREVMTNTLAEEKLNGSITISQVMVRGIVPADNIVASANLLVEAQNDNKRKAVEVGTAKLEAERIAALNANAGATKYMEATALVTIAEAIKAGKVSAIVVPYDFKGIIQTGNR